MVSARRCSSSASRASPRQIFASYDLGPPDAMLVFSAGGLTAVPIEMAMGARERGLPVVAVTSVGSRVRGDTLAFLRYAAHRPRGRRRRPLHTARGRAHPGRRRRYPGVARLERGCGGDRERDQGAHCSGARGAGAASACDHKCGSRRPEALGGALRCGLCGACAPGAALTSPRIAQLSG